MSLKKRLLEQIPDTRTNLRQFGRSLNYDEATTDRALRALTEDSKIMPVYKGKYIVAYTKYKTHEDITDPDEELERLKANTPVNWENQTKLKELIKALKSKEEYYKKSIIIKYNQI